MEQKIFIEVSCYIHLRKTFSQLLLLKVYVVGRFFSDRIKTSVVQFGLYEYSLDFRDEKTE